MHVTHRQSRPAGPSPAAPPSPVSPAAPAVPAALTVPAVPAIPVLPAGRTEGHRAAPCGPDGIREQALRLVAEAVSAGLPLPARLHAHPGPAGIVIGAADRAAWDSWRQHLGCPDIAVHVHDSAGTIRRSSTAQVLLSGLRVAVELSEDIDPSLVRASVCRPGTCP